MRRREFLTGSSALAGLLALSPPTAARPGPPVDADLPLTPGPVLEPATPARLRASVAAARHDFRAVRYRELAARLPTLTNDATAAVHAASHDRQAAANAVLAEVYIIGARLAIKLHEQGSARILADRAVAAAVTSTEPTVIARAHRTTAVVLRRSASQDQACGLLTRAAHQLRTDTGLQTPDVASLYASMLATAAYTAALAGQRDTAWTLTNEAKTALPAPGGGFGSNDLTLYQAGIARILGDYGQAVKLISQVRPRLFRAPERQARYWEDTALAWMGRGRPALAYEALREAERAAPQEVRYRPWAHQLTASLLLADVRHELLDLSAFATRIGLPTAGT